MFSYRVQKFRERRQRLRVLAKDILSALDISLISDNTSFLICGEVGHQAAGATVGVPDLAEAISFLAVLGGEVFCLEQRHEFVDSTFEDMLNGVVEFRLLFREQGLFQLI